MLQLSDLLARIPVPEGEAAHASSANASSGQDDKAVDLVTDLGAGLPSGHVHLWGGPAGAGKTAFLLTLLTGAAQCRRRVVYASYDLSAPTLARRLLAMTAGVSPEDLPDPGGTCDESSLDDDAWVRVCAARRYLGGLPFSVLEARGFTTESLRDRLARMPFRADVLAVDYLQAVVRERNTNLHTAVSQLTELAHGMHVAIVCAVRPDEGVRNREVASRGFASGNGTLPDRVGWLEPSGESDRRADVVLNRHGPQTSNVLRMHRSGALERRT